MNQLLIDKFQLEIQGHIFASLPIGPRPTWRTALNRLPQNAGIGPSDLGGTQIWDDLTADQVAEQPTFLSHPCECI
jgi:hypothetical protein